MASTASELGMSIGLKNAQSLLATDGVIDAIQFAVNEECVTQSDCAPYDPLIAAGKPVFHVEYVTYSVKNGNPVLKSSDSNLSKLGSDALKAKLCLQGSSEGSTFSTIIKTLDLDGFVEYCDGSWANTPSSGGSDN
jgi:hypothetical protein